MPINSMYYVDLVLAFCIIISLQLFQELTYFTKKEILQ